MALIYCTECGKQVSDKAASCPNCGNPVNKTTTQNASNEDFIKCPKCDSTQVTSNKKGFSGGKAVAGAVLTGGIGLLAGTIGSGNVIITCLKCGYKFKAGEYNKEKRKLNKPSDSEVINQNPLQFIIIFFSLLSAVFIPLLFGGSWWFLLIMPVVGFSLLIAIESIQGKNKKTKPLDKPLDKPSRILEKQEIDNKIREYIKEGKLLAAADYYRSHKGVDFIVAKDYVDDIASKL